LLVGLQCTHAEAWICIAAKAVISESKNQLCSIYISRRLSSLKGLAFLLCQRFNWEIFFWCMLMTGVMTANLSAYVMFRLFFVPTVLHVFQMFFKGLSRLLQYSFKYIRKTIWRGSLRRKDDVFSPLWYNTHVQYV
jgi:hypothetical protein